MKQKLNKVVHDPRARTVFISLRPRSQRRPESSLEYPGRVVLDLDAEGDLYGVRLLDVDPRAAEAILLKLGVEPPGAQSDQ